MQKMQNAKALCDLSAPSAVMHFFAFTVFLKYENLLLIAASIPYPCPYGSNDRFSNQ